MAKKDKKKKFGSMRDRATQRAKERENENSTGPSYLVGVDKDEMFNLEGKKTTINIVPYVVSTSKHPDKVPAGELWYQFPSRFMATSGWTATSTFVPPPLARSAPSASIFAILPRTTRPTKRKSRKATNCCAENVILAGFPAHSRWHRMSMKRPSLRSTKTASWNCSCRSVP